MQKRRRISDSVLTGVVPRGLDRLRKPSAARSGYLSSLSTTSSPAPWAVFNFDIFWVLVNSNGNCGRGGGRQGAKKACGRRCVCKSQTLTRVCPKPSRPTGCHGCCEARCPYKATKPEKEEEEGEKKSLDDKDGNTDGQMKPFECFIHSDSSQGSNSAVGRCCGSSSGNANATSSTTTTPSNACGGNNDGSSAKGFCCCCHHCCCNNQPTTSRACHRQSTGAHCSAGGGNCNDGSNSKDGETNSSLNEANISHHQHQQPPPQPLDHPNPCHNSSCTISSCDNSAESKERKLSRDSGVECDDVPSEQQQNFLGEEEEEEADTNPTSASAEETLSSSPTTPSPEQATCCGCSCSCCGGLPLVACPCIDAEQVNSLKEEARQLRAGDVTHREGSQVKGSTMRVAGDGFSAHRSAISEQQQRQTKTPAGTINQESSRQAAKSALTIKTKGVCTKQSSSMTSSQSNVSITGFDDLDLLNASSQHVDIENAIKRYSGVMSSFVEQLKNLSIADGLKDAPTLLENIDEMLRRAWSVPVHGHELGFSLCSVLRTNGGMSILLDNCSSDNYDLKFSSAKVLEQCLTTENRGYVVENGLKSIVNVACDCTKNGTSVDKSRVGTGILEHLFKHSEGTCSDIIKMGGLDAVLSECRKSDVETLRHCAGALANLSLYGGSDNQQEMIQRKVPMWLFPLAFHVDENIKYYACLAIATLVANKELEAAVLQSGTLNLVEPFVTSQIPDLFADSTVAHRHGQSQNWLKRLLPVLSSKREEARNLAAFHFCMEAGIKKRQQNLDIFRDIGAIEPLKEVASSPNAIASKYAVHALRLIGEEVPHKLSQQVPLWTPKDVREWVKQIGFIQFCDAFESSRVDGDLLLQLTEENLREDICIKNGILRQRFLRELRKLKNLADYSSCDSTKMNEFLVEMDREFAEYTYTMLRAGVSREMLRYLTEEQLIHECGIVNSIHRQRIRDFITNDGGQLQDANSVDKNLDIFISYRRSNGSQLASLLKVHMQLKEFSVFIDVERLEAGKFDNNLLNSIRQAKNFLLVLTPNALDRCLGDTECKDWVHREIVAALQSGCNIIPILDNFQWPEPEELPEDMRAVCYFNGVRWIHDYQDACVDKIERFMRGEGNLRGEGQLGRYVGGSLAGGMATPGTPLPRAPPLFQRTTSTESGKGSSCSDKDFAKD